MTARTSLTTPAIPFAPAPVRPTRASVRFAPSSAPLMTGSDESDPASVQPSGTGMGDEDAPPSSGPASASDVEPGADHAGEGARPPSGTNLLVNAAIVAPGYFFEPAPLGSLQQRKPVS